VRKRYGTTKRGKTTEVAKIYEQHEHRIDNEKIDGDAIKVAGRLKKYGYQAFLVGGAVRDLVLDKVPKDFDLVTDATPQQIKATFRNARIIGKRFRLVHVYFPGKIIELSTFRASSPGEEDQNVYGAIDEDVHRRDFSVNALFYDPLEKSLVDFVGGLEDIRAGRMRSLIPLHTTFKEDPVRIIRAIKYSEMHGFRLGWGLKRSLKKYAPELDRIPPSRITEEVFKILQSGYSAPILRAFIAYKVLRHILPVIDALLRERSKSDKDRFFDALEKIDERVREKGEDRKGRLLAALVDGVILFPEEWENSTMLFKDMFREIKRLIEPITPPNQEVEMAVVWLFREAGIKPPPNVQKKKKPPQSGGGRRRSGGRKPAGAHQHHAKQTH
jgi:poly(A) polymerase